MHIDKKEISRFARQLILKDFNEKKQKNIFKTHITFIGLGGINSPAIIYLLYAGIRNITIIDNDIVKENNLNRQILFREKDLGKNKAITAKKFLKKINPKLKIDIYNKKFDKTNSSKLVKKTDLVLDGTDNWDSMLKINDYCVNKNISLLTSSITGYDGNLIFFKNIKKKHLCLRCIFPNEKEVDLPRCETVGVLGTSAGIIGLLSAHKIMNYLIMDKKIKPEIIYFDGRNVDIKKINIYKNPNCKLLKK